MRNVKSSEIAERESRQVVARRLPIETIYTLTDTRIPAEAEATRDGVQQTQMRDSDANARHNFA
jgi:hypothetical protein